MPTNPDELFQEASCFRCNSNASESDLLELAFLQRIANAIGSAGCFQCSSGSGAPVAAPAITTQPAQYRDTASGFNYRWDVQSQTWAPIPRVYRAILNQAGTNPPVSTVLENTLSGTPVWSRLGVGSYRLTLAGSFSQTKTLLMPQTYYDPISLNAGYQVEISADPNFLDLNAYVASPLGGSDDVLLNASFGFLLYP